MKRRLQDWTRADLEEEFAPRTKMQKVENYPETASPPIEWQLDPSERPASPLIYDSPTFFGLEPEEIPESQQRPAPDYITEETSAYGHYTGVYLNQWKHSYDQGWMLYKTLIEKKDFRKPTTQREQLAKNLNVIRSEKEKIKAQELAFSSLMRKTSRERREAWEAKKKAEAIIKARSIAKAKRFAFIKEKQNYWASVRAAQIANKQRFG